MTRRELAAAIEKVDGWLGLREAWALHRAARDAPGPDPVVVEVGSWMGRSTIVLALALRERGAGTVVAVDPHQGGPIRWAGLDTRAVLHGNLAAAGVTAFARPVDLPSPAAAAVVDGPIDVLFLDGSHEYEDVRADLEGWVPLLRSGARVAFHDAPGYRGVNRLVRERVLVPGPFRRPRIVQSTLLATYEPGRGWRRRDAAAAAWARAELCGRRRARRLRSRL